MESPTARSGVDMGMSPLQPARSLGYVLAS